MAVLGPYGVTLQVPDIEPGAQYYSEAGLLAKVDGNTAHLTCYAGAHECITLLGGAARKRLHHLSLRADPALFDEVRRAASRSIESPSGFVPRRPGKSASVI